MPTRASPHFKEVLRGTGEYVYVCGGDRWYAYKLPSPHHDHQVVTLVDPITGRQHVYTLEVDSSSTATPSATALTAAPATAPAAAPAAVLKAAVVGVRKASGPSRATPANTPRVSPVDSNRGVHKSKVPRFRLPRFPMLKASPRGGYRAVATN